MSTSARILLVQRETVSLQAYRKDSLQVDSAVFFWLNGKGTFVNGRRIFSS